MSNHSIHSSTTARPSSPAESPLHHQNGTIAPLATSANEKRLPLFGSKDEAFRKQRKTMGMGIIKVFVMITLLLWLCLPIFWGSTWLILPYIPNLTISYINFETSPTSILGPAFDKYAQSTFSIPRDEVHLGYVIRDPALYPNGLADVEREIEEQKFWAAIVVNANATSAWRAAAENGGAYDGSGAISIYFEGARFYQVILLYLQPLLEQNARAVITTATATAYQTLLSSLSPSYTVPSSAGTITKVTTTLATLQSSPAVMGSPFGFTAHDLKPQTAWAAAAVFEAGDIYFLIFAFHLVLWHAIGRQKSGIEKKLTLTGLFGLRLMVPLVLYFFMALWYTCIIAAFQIPFDLTLGRAGFVVDWALNYVALCAMGLAFETMFSVLGMKFLPFFLIFWIITNITSSFFPIQLMEKFYQFLRWAPFMHHIEASKIIFFNTGPAGQLGVHFGALFGLAGVNVVGLGLAVWFERWREERGEKKARNRGQ